jgi:hypothetical protein
MKVRVIVITSSLGLILFGAFMLDCKCWWMGFTSLALGCFCFLMWPLIVLLLEGDK